MKKILSIILCLSMLMSSAVFAAPVSFAPIDVESAVEIDHTFAGTENEEAEAELSALPALAPVATYPANGASDVTVGDPAYKVTFSKAINPEDVTIENLGVAEGTVAGIYLDEGTNTVYLFPDSKKHDAVGATVSFPAIQSNISTADGANCLYFPAVSYSLNGSHGNDGENMVPYGNMEYGWVPLYGNDPATMYTEADGNHAVKIGGGSNGYKYFYVPVHFEPYTEYTYSYKIKTLENDSRAAATIRYEPSTHSDGKTHFGKSGNVNTTTWTTITATHTTGEVTSTKGDSLANYVEPLSGKGVEFLVDDIVITKKVKINFAAGRNTVLNGTAPATLSGYNGETVTLPTTDAFATTDARWAIFGWTDGENTYNGGQEYTINGGKTLTPYVVALEDTMKVSFTSNMNGITLPETVEIFAGDSVDLTASEFQFDVVGYWFDGWAVKGTDEIITSISPDADVELEAKFSLMDYWDFTKKAHYDAFDVGDSNKTKKEYNSENGFVVTPLGTDTQITITSNTPVINADDYARAEITFVKSSRLNESIRPQMFFAAPGKWETGSTRVLGSFDRYEGENDKFIVYTFDMISNANWTGGIGRLRIDPYDEAEQWTVKSVRFLKNTAVESVEIADIEAPVVRNVPDVSVTTSSDVNYEVTSVTWTPVVADIFAPETKYTVNVTVKAATGYAFDSSITTATINGEAATVTVNIDKTATISYEFDATESLIPVTVTADKSVTAITEDGGTIELSATVETVDSEDVIDTYDVIWSVDDDTLAYVEGNVLHAFNNGKVTVTATSVYDASKSDSFEVEISGQTLFPVTFHAGTVSSGVTNLPEGFDFKGTLDLTKYPAPVRSGYTFMGWKTATYAEETATSVDVYAPTTIYASWVEGQSWEFNTDGSMDGFPQMSASKDNVVKDGCYSFTSTTNDPNGGFWSTLNINADKFKTIEIRMHSSVASYAQIFFRGTNATTLAEKYSAKLDTKANADGEFSTYVFNMGSIDGWSGTVDTLRFDFVNKTDATIKIDYVRILNNVEEFVDIGGIDEPSVMAEADTDAEALAASKFEVKSFEWEQNLIDGKYFDGGVAYTAKAVVAAKAGVQIADNAVATVNGNTATITKNADGTYTVEYTFPATETLTDVKVVADETKNAITTPDGKIELSAKVIDVATGEDFADQGIEWSVDNTAACTLEGNVLTAVYDAEVNVTATSTYNRAKKATYKVTITNQIPPKTLTFHKGTNAAVSGMPASVVGKKPVDLTQYAAPTREGYIFSGWALDKAGKNIVTSVELTSDVTVYAIWKYGISYEFNKDGDFEGFPKLGQVSDIGVKDGCYYFTTSGTDPNATLGGLNIDASNFNKVEIRLSANMAETFQLFFSGTNASISETNSKKIAYQANAAGEFQTLVFDMSDMVNWTGTIKQLRFDPTSVKGLTMKIDYVRVVRDVCEFVDVTDLTAPVAKAVADLDAKGANEDLYVVKGVEWSPALLYKQYHDGEVAYTANITVAAAKGSILSTGPVATVNGKEATVSKVNDDGSVVVSYTFPKTGVIDNKDAVEITLNSKDNSGNTVPEVRTVFVGETFALGSNLVTACPEGMRWVGWAETDGDASTIMDSIVTVKDVNRTFYALYEEITEFDFANKYHHNVTVNEAKSYEIADGAVTVVAVDELSNISANNIKLDTLDYASVEVIVDKALTTTTAAPVIKFNVGNAWIKSSEVAEITYEGNAAYKYTFHPVNEDYWTGTVNSLAVNVPEEGQWAVRSIKFIPTKAVSVTIEGAEIISRPGRVIEYTAKIKVLDGTSIPRTDIAVEIVSMLDENGVAVAPADFSKYAYIEKGTTKLYPVRDCTLTIRGTSNYNKRAYDEISVVIKNQGTQYLVSYDLNASGVTGSAPASELAKGSFTPSVCTATRNGYFFSGWSTDPDDADAVSESFNITENTTLYAIWGKGVGYEFNTGTASSNGATMYSYGIDSAHVDTAKGVYTGVFQSKDPQLYLNSTYNAATKTGGLVDASRTKRIEMRFATDAPVTMWPYIFFQNCEAETGDIIVGSYGSTPTLYVQSQTTVKNALKGGDLTNYQTVVWDMSSKELWRGIITNIRLDPTDDQAAIGKTVDFDYIRFIDDYRDVKFNANGGTITKGDQVVSETTENVKMGTFTVPFTPEKVGSKFVGWCRNANGTSKVYTSGSVKVADDVTFYAIWAPTADVTNESSVTITNGSGTVYNNGSALVYEGDGITVDEVDYRVADAATVSTATDTTLLMKLSYNYKSTTDNSITLIYDDANGQPQETIIASGLPNSMDSGYVLVKLTDPAITPAITGNITNVRVEMPEGVANSIAVEELTITDYDTAYSIYYDYMTYEAPEVEVSIGNAEDNANPKTYAPSTQPPVVPGAIGGGTPAGSTVGTNNNSAAGGTGSGTSMIVPAAPTAGTGTGTGTGTSTPVIGNQTIANNFKFKNEYNANTFTDVKSGDWFYGDVEKSYKLGLMNGKGGAIFDPNGAVTIAEAVTVASRIYAICVGKTIPAAKTGEAWYTPYVNYAIDAKIIKNGQFADYTVKATRKQVAEIFANCAPSGWLNVINMFTSIPDVDSKDASFKAILSLYNAGILTGVDASYKFNPAAEIKRSEMSAIINRVAIPESRIRVVTEVEKTEAPFISGANGDEATLAGFYTGGNSKISSVADPTDSTNEVYQIKIEKQGKVWSYLWHKMKLKAGETYKIEADIYLVSDFNGNPLTGHSYGLAFRYEGKDHGFGGGKIDSGKWVHVSKEYTVPASYQAQVGADAFGIYMDPSNDNGVTYLVDNLSVLPASGSVEIGGSSTSSTGSSAGTTSANAATSVQFKSADDFSVYNIDGLKVNGSFKGTSTTNDANVVYKKNVNLNASEIKQIKIVAKIPKGKGAEVFFTTDSDKALSGSKRYGFTSTSDDFATYTINTSSNEHWKGTIVQFRFDPVVGEGLDFEWKSIEFVK